jgi:TolB-like protein/Tfp pilus assembly protein PilF
MKSCPKCERVYTDDSLNFCLEDGADLSVVREDAEDTAILRVPPSASEQPTRTFDSSGIGDTGARPTSRYLALGGLTVLVVAALVAGGVWLYGRGEKRQIDSIAVLPFANASGNPDVEYLADGLTDTLINGLGKIPGLNVKARSTVFRYKGQTVDPMTLGRDLSVKAVLNGRVVQHGDDLSIYLSLDDTSTGDNIWSETYDRKASELVALQKEIARDVSQKLQLRLTGEDVQRVTKSYTNDPEAYQLYLRGRFRILRSTTQDNEAAREYFQKAIDRDPTYAMAYVGLADAYRAPVAERLPSEALAKSKAAAQKALEIDDTLSDAHAVLGFIIFWYEWNWAAAEAELKRAIELDPKNSEAHNFYAHLLSNSGRHEEALSEARLSRELDPLNLRANALEGQFLIHAGRVDDGIARLNACLELDRDHWMVHLFLTSAYIEKGMMDKAIEEGRKTVEINPHSRSFSYLGYALAKAGREGEAREELKKILAAAEERWVSPYSVAMLYNGLNDREQALAWLEKGVTERDPRMVFLKVEPKWNNLRDDPRFRNLMQKVGFPP